MVTWALPPPVNSETDRETRLKTLPSRNFVGGGKNTGLDHLESINIPVGYTNLTDVAVLRIALTGSSSPVPLFSTQVIVHASTIVCDVHSCSPIFTANVNGVCNSQVVNKVENKGSNFHFSTGFSSKQASSFPPPKVKILQRLNFQLRFWLNCRQATFTDLWLKPTFLLYGSTITKLF